jgi:hypothetical protein
MGRMVPDAAHPLGTGLMQRLLNSLRAIRYSLDYFALLSPGKLPQVLARLHEETAGYVLSPRRSKRRYPRAVRIKMSGYDRKRTPATQGRRRRAN